jgi:hypothetical protein
MGAVIQRFLCWMFGHKNNICVVVNLQYVCDRCERCKQYLPKGWPW